MRGRRPTTKLAETTTLAAPISISDTEGARLLLQAGADPNRLPSADLYGSDHAGDPPWPAVYAAVRSAWRRGITGLAGLITRSRAYAPRIE